MITMQPPVEKTGTVVLEWTKKALTSDVIPMIKKELEQGGILLIPNTTPEVELLTVTQASLERQAQNERLIKRRRITDTEFIMDHFQVANRSQFLMAVPGRDPNQLFTQKERSLLVLGILEDISIKNNVKLKEQLVQQTNKANTNILRYILESQGWIQKLAPVHFDEAKEKIQKATMWPLWQIMPPVLQIEEYYGPTVAYYFAFVGFLAQWSGYLGIIGLSTFLLRVYRQDTIDEDEYTPFYGLICFLWAILFYIFWQRNEAVLAYQFGTLELSTSLEDDEVPDDPVVHKRPEYHGKVRESPVTGKYEIYYPSINRKLHYVVSALVTVIMLVVAFTVMIISLNVQGYIRPRSDDDYHPFYWPRVASMAGTGELFDAMSSWKSFLPVIIHALSIMTLNKIYRKIATKLTDWENHQSQTDYDNSLILKRFLFEAFDCYIALFYLAFYACDIEQLRSELIAVFNIDSFRRVLTEVAIPMIAHRVTKKAKVEGHPQDLDLEVYESFDDWMEVLIQFGYVTLFASAYPMASLVMSVALMIELRSDCYKLTYLCQKPKGEQVSSIGMWKRLLQFMVWFSCLTNCLLFGFTSDQMLHYMPDFYMRDEEGNTHIVQDKGWMAILIIFALERVLIYIGLALTTLIPTIPEQLLIKLKRRKYLLHMNQKKKEE
ncbi:unnamed protein product [Cylindrotheca closterium]|uniref:Anoctamin transmembrane domain-containing protein n=1 Tax=Cylindrotheca closterium TaxID=2856 RepID=A0AAD2CUP1_9STRA|nr:unnamed protein product [Cylindrotheca closterium]